jgi:hypothetical protein
MKNPSIVLPPSVNADLHPCGKWEATELVGGHAEGATSVESVPRKRRTGQASPEAPTEPGGYPTTHTTSHHTHHARWSDALRA